LTNTFKVSPGGVSMRNILLSLEYDGTAYHGWQRQLNGLTIQEVLETCISRICQEKIVATACSRTDAGVHALDQKVNFRTDSKAPLAAFHLGLNALLPRDIRVIDATSVSPDFNARYAAQKKTYSYYFAEGTHLPAILRQQCWFVVKPIHWDKVASCLVYLQGAHDFKSFQAADCASKKTLRSLDSIVLTHPDLQFPMQKLALTRLTFQGKSFLKHMIRNIVGTLYLVGIDKLSRESFAEIVLARDRTKAGPCAPPQGLFLEKVLLK
jgi:tRNA pseudouridine38-40 synthase